MVTSAIPKAALPPYVGEAGLQVIKVDEIWNTLDDDRSISPRFGLGVFEILDDTFEQHFKFKAKYPLNVVLPRIPSRHALFWASLFGELPNRHASIVQCRYSEPLEIRTVDETHLLTVRGDDMRLGRYSESVPAATAWNGVSGSR